MENNEPRSKRLKRSYSSRYRLCGHCDRELSVKFYKEHRRLYYDSERDTWIKDIKEDSDCSSTEFSSVDDVGATSHTESIDSDCNFQLEPACDDVPECEDSQGKYLVLTRMGLLCGSCFALLM